jgi:chromosome segregation ATPase
MPLAPAGPPSTSWATSAAAAPVTDVSVTPLSPRSENSATPHTKWERASNEAELSKLRKTVEHLQHELALTQHQREDTTAAGDTANAVTAGRLSDLEAQAATAKTASTSRMTDLEALVKKGSEEEKRLKASVASVEAELDSYRAQFAEAGKLFETVVGGDNATGEYLRKEWKSESLKVGKWTMASVGMDVKMSFAARQLESLGALRERCAAMEVELQQAQLEATTAREAAAAATAALTIIQAENTTMKRDKEDALQNALQSKKHADVIKMGQETDIAQIFSLQLTIESMNKESEGRVAEFSTKLESLVLELQGLKEKEAISTKRVQEMERVGVERETELATLREQLKTKEDELRNKEDDYERELDDCEEEIASLKEQMTFSSPFTDSKGVDGMTDAPPRASTTIGSISSLLFLLGFMIVLFFLFGEVNEINRGLKLF